MSCFCIGFTPFTPVTMGVKKYRLLPVLRRGFECCGSIRKQCYGHQNRRSPHLPQSQRSKLDTHRRGRGRFINLRKAQRLEQRQYRAQSLVVWIGMSLLLKCTLSLPFINSSERIACNSSETVFPSVYYSNFWVFSYHGTLFSPDSHIKSSERVHLSRGGKWFWSPWQRIPHQKAPCLVGKSMVSGEDFPN